MSEGSFFDAAASLIRSANHLVAFTGAGISTPSGVPDFRSAGSGLWNKVNPMEAASLSTFLRRPERFYAWLHPLAISIAGASPNPAHLALAKLEAAGRLKAVVTQNIDDLHQRAGSRQVIQVHGSLKTSTCLQCERQYSSEMFEKDFLEQQVLPCCPQCAAILKPDITLFEEGLPEDAWQQAEWHMRQADLVLIIGTSLEVMPASMLPLMAANAGASLIINTRSNTFLDSRAAFVFKDDAAVVLPALIERALRLPD